MNTPLYIVDARALSWNAQQILQGALRVAGAPSVVTTTFPPQGKNVILACGQETLSRLVPDAPPVREARGYMWDTAWGRVVASMSPEDIVTDWTPWRALFDLDLRRALTELRTGSPPFHVPDVTVVTNATQGEACWKACRAAEWVGADIENTQELELACMGFADSINHAYVIPAGEAWQRELIRNICGDQQVCKVFQNGQYDRLFLLRQCDIRVRAHVFDTQLAWHALNPELAGKKTEVGYKKAKSKRTAKSLRFLASIYCRGPFWKCLDADTLVLMRDLTWKPMRELTVGDELLAPSHEDYDGSAASRSKPAFRESTVLGVSPIQRKQCYRVVTPHGELIATADHRVATGSNAGHGRGWRTVGALVPWDGLGGHGRAQRIYWTRLTPWKTLTSREAGWLAGFYDGEGAVSKNSGTVCFAQNPGMTCERAKLYLEKLGFQFKDYETGKKTRQVHTRGGKLEAMRFLGSVRPERLVANYLKYLIGSKSFSTTVPVLAKEDAGERETVDIMTSTGAFIANGFVVHNSYEFTSEHERYVLCGRDCAYTLDIAEKQAKQLEAA